MRYFIRLSAPAIECDMVEIPVHPASLTMNSDPIAALQPILTSDLARPYVVAQLGQSLDGRIATPTGASKYINGPAALDFLHRLRASVDAVVVGIGTVLADDPLLTVRRVPGRNPSRVIIDPNGRLPKQAKCLSDGSTDVYVVSSKENYDSCEVRTLRVAAGPEGMEPSQIVNTLFASGFRRILIEGGANTVSRFLAAGAVDRLYLLVAPLLLGSGQPGLVMPPIDGLEEALRPQTQCYSLGEGDVLFDCCFTR
jgi:diaminohydroxyphosphoribosylaminopyrimidine deaminase/5-amino-6-(5-phosphoribosylamino)uracil reductase